MADSLTVYQCPEHGTNFQPVLFKARGRPVEPCPSCVPVLYEPREVWLGRLTSAEAVEAVARAKFPVMASAWLEQRVRDEVRADLGRLRALYEN